MLICRKIVISHSLQDSYMSLKASIDICSQQLDWNLTTQAVFSHFSHLKWAMLLDSADASHTDAKYDIICLQPAATLISSKEKQAPANQSINKLTISATNQSQLINGNPFDAIKHVLTNFYSQSQCHKNLPFTGGAVGSFNYDLGRTLEKLPVTASQDIAMADLNIGFYDWALIYCYQTQSWTLTHCRGQKALIQSFDWILSQFAFSKTMTSKLSKGITNQPFKLLSNWQNQITEQEYHQKFNQIQNYLHSGDCYQVNLTQRFQAQYQGDEWQAYLRLRNSNKAPFSAFIRLPEQVILSISPERFIKLNESKIETKPIKGTLPRHTDSKLDQIAANTLRQSTKDRAENLMIVDLLRNDIGKVAKSGTVKVPKLFDIESFPAVHHMVSTIEAELRSELDATDLLKNAFPGGSITGAPKIRAMEIIEELEPSRRSLYCGAIGYISCNGNMDTSITIRTLIAENSQLYCWAGGGIVADSTAEAEYQETFDKISRILPVLSQNIIENDNQ